MAQEKNVFHITETAVLRRGFGEYYIVAKTADGLLYEHTQIQETVDAAIMWADNLKGTTLISEDWYSLVKVL